MEATLSPCVAIPEQLQIELATKLGVYHKKATPLWTRWSERLGYAREFASSHDHAGFKNFLLAYRHNEGRHAAAKAAEPEAPTAK